MAILHYQCIPTDPPPHKATVLSPANFHCWHLKIQQINVKEHHCKEIDLPVLTVEADIDDGGIEI